MARLTDAELDAMAHIRPLTNNLDGTTRPTAVAVDFDGCLCTNAWPDIGEPNTALIDWLKAFRAGGGELILWTCREGEALMEAITWCRAHYLCFDAANENLPHWNAAFGNDCRKIGADYYIDDKAVCVKAEKEATQDV